MKTLKLPLCKTLLATVFCIAALTSCNKEPGLGGTSSLEGVVYNIVHYDDNYSFATDTFTATKKDVYLIFGDKQSDYFGDDVETDLNGKYRFDYLRKGDYLIYAYSELPNSLKEPVVQKVSVGKGTTKAEPIYIHTGKAYGTSMVRGQVNVVYCNGESVIDEGEGTGIRAYIRNLGEEYFFDDVRVVNGKFIFQKLLKGKYEIGVETQDCETEKVTLIIKQIEITETGKIYDVESVYNVYKSV
ncbi:MAG: hypothetical protein LBS50_10280 [Prevotellaceae bacterium]|jgi:hypothetical protein|nr:hypothetical protein [Prevotellaceae bacterium]